MWRANDNPFLGISPKIVMYEVVLCCVTNQVKYEVQYSSYKVTNCNMSGNNFVTVKQQLSRNVTLHGPCLGCHFRALLVGNLRSSSQQHPEPRLHSGAKGTPANVTLRYIDECNPWMRQPHLLGAKTKLHGHNTYTRKSSPRN
ncbi:hypothetical protein CISG_09415 [Coccidioides immitis RMSCC 3703]|uniref:Uncharacterized protein n=1 Tax=Coccidioides immitis RMSCC 3703 TaxID=454286 RepID=A0A0J8RDI0_COCIT|nr:hypothetical protein CISG_09415 [Coccidioides immitis RMSCC 3703]